MKRWSRSFFLTITLIFLAGNGHAAVDYVRVCSLYGTGFMYVPGTDTCFNPTTGETRQLTEGGVWHSHVPSPGTWVGNPKLECLLGRLVKVGTFTSDDFTLNPYYRYETDPVPLTLRPDEFISKVMFNGGFEANRATFCLSFYDVANGFYSVLGCQDSAQLKDQAATWAFTPLRSVPPANFTRPFRLIGHNGSDLWREPPANGSLTSWVCVERVLR